MSNHLDRDIDSLNASLISVSAVVEEMIDKSVRALIERRGDLARETIQQDEEVDRREVRIEEECLKLIALHQPVAIMLRRIATVLKVNNDLERIADLAANIAERAQALAEYPRFENPADLDKLAQLATAMVRDSLDALVAMDVEKARDVLTRDDEVDEQNLAIIVRLRTIMQDQADAVTPALHCFSATRHLERIADHATNIAEDVIYVATGEIIRHRHDMPPRAPTVADENAPTP